MNALVQSVSMRMVRVEDPADRVPRRSWYGGTGRVPGNEAIRGTDLMVWWMLQGGLTPPDEAQFRAIHLWYTIGAFCVFILGVFVFYLSFGQPPEKADLAAKARWVGPCLMATAVAMKPGWVIRFVNWLSWINWRATRHER